MQSAGDAGFTLVELMVAIAIVAVLATVAVPLWRGQSERGELRQAQLGLVQLAMVADAHLIQRGTYRGMALLGDTGIPAIWQPPQALSTIEIHIAEATDDLYRLEALRRGRVVLVLHSDGRRSSDMNDDGVIAADELRW